MASLVKVTKEGRLFLKVGGAFFGLFFIIYLFVKGGSLIQTVFFPKPPPLPEEALGKLPHIAFPSVGTPGLEFKINTIDGELPVLPDRVNVYKLLQPEPNLLALESAKNILGRQNFVENQIKISDTLYQWTQSISGITIRYDIVTKNYVIASNYLFNPNLTSQSQLPSEDYIKSDIHGFIGSISEKTDNLDLEKTKIEYLELQNGILVPAENLGKSRFARISIQQKEVDKIPIINDVPNESVLTFLVSYPESGIRVLEGQFINQEPNMDAKSDYPIKTAAQAIEDLKKGNAYMINPQNLSRVDVTNVELKYYLNKNSFDFLMPVIIVTGINFTGYVEAIPSTSLSN